MDAAEWRLTRKVPIDTAAVDGLRGFAVFHIIVGHLFIYVPTKPGGLYLMGGGSMGLFYIISGFVMAVGYCQVMLERPKGCAWLTCICWPTWDDPSEGRSYAKLSSCTFWFWLTNILGIIMRFSLQNSWEVNEYENRVTWLNVLLTFLGLTSWVFPWDQMGSFPVGNELTWTISTMLFFYICFPALAPRMQRVPLHRLPILVWTMYVLQAIAMSTCTVTLGFLVFHGSVDTYWFRMTPPLRLPIFIMGIAAGLIRVQRQQAAMKDADLDVSPVNRGARPEELDEACCCCAQEPCLGPLSLFVIWLIITTFAAVQGSLVGEMQFIINRLALEVFYPILFYYWILALTNPARQNDCLVRLFKSRVMRFLGDISMCCYMIHLLLLEFTGYLVKTRHGFHPWWTILSTLFATILLGWLFTRFYEKPIARCLRFSSKSETDQPSKAAAPSPPATEIGKP
ncbi:unnamed protein product [Durusdinium trenchii]|uniref:Acyltransferase 3 domain-containing protein n=1 Tax=Durusdinium trenchii TaxID=1381693 RepID=A0ABP0HFG0_9DINO